MRVRLPFARIVFTAAVALLALFALLPMRLLADWIDLGGRGLSAREVQGSLWFGRFAEAGFRGIPLGDLDARLRLLPLLTGEARIDLSRGDGFRAAVAVTPRGFGIAGMTARVPLGQRFAPMPIAAIDVTDLQARFQAGLCDRADGLVKVELQGDFAGLTLPGGLTGTARCDAGKLLFPLASQSGMERLAIRFAGDGTFRAEMIVQPGNDAARKTLSEAGFSEIGAGQVLAIEGRL
jgi:general secretion pathway protein N